MTKRLACVLLFGIACSPRPPASGQTPPEGMVAQQVAGHTLFLRPGFKITVFASADGVRNLVLGPGGAVYAALQGPGRVVRIAHADGDTVAGAISDAATGLNGPFGIAFRGDTMYVGEMTKVTRFAPGSTSGQTIVAGLPSGGHSTRTVVFGPDGAMYVAVGSSCNICNESDQRRAAVTRFSPDGSAEHRFATGLRNSVGLAFNPSTGELWATNNDRDNLGDDIPPDRINIIKDGKYYGWPQCYLPGQRNPEYSSAACSNVEPPAITFQAHSAPLGMTFYTGSAFPAEYRGDAFVAFHGSWNRSVPTGDKVVRVQVVNGKPTAIDDFITGWQRPDGSRWGRPVSIVMTTDGALLVSDDMGGKIWRVAYGR
jgi:glucose/arabinose dehydrogenase